LILKTPKKEAEGENKDGNRVKEITLKRKRISWWTKTRTTYAGEFAKMEISSLFFIVTRKNALERKRVNSFV
jgi:hypothetical protein